MISKKDRYKRFISFISALVLLGLLVGIFAYFWYKYYSDSIVLPYDMRERRDIFPDKPYRTKIPVRCAYPHYELCGFCLYKHLDASDGQALFSHLSAEKARYPLRKPSGGGSRSENESARG